MMVRDLIKALENMPDNAAVIFPGGHGGHTTTDEVEDVIQVEDCILTDGSTYPVVMVCHEPADGWT